MRPPLENPERATRMNESEFSQRADDLILAIEEAFDASGADIDCEVSSGVMTLTMDVDDSKVIISRQPALSQIWLAAKSGGFHFDLKNDEWVCTSTNETLRELLCRVCGEQAGEAVELEF